MAQDRGEGSRDGRRSRKARRRLRPEDRQEPVLIERAGKKQGADQSHAARQPSEQRKQSPYRRIEETDAPNWQENAAGVATDPDTLNLGILSQRAAEGAAPHSGASAKAPYDERIHRPASPREAGRVARANRRRRRAERSLLHQTASYVAHWISGGFALTSLAAVAVCLALIAVVPRNLPDHRSLLHYQPALRSIVLDGKGEKAAEFAPTNRIFVTLDKIPGRVVAAFLAAEDQRFFEHDGFDLKAVGRAALANLGLYGTTVGLQGGSTITQQVAKNLLLSSDRTIERKVKELILAWRIEQSLTKKQILEIYLNEIFMGRTAYGIAAAARTYFGKTLDQLDIAETAFLAGLPQAPSRYNPDSRPKVSKARRNHVLDRMLAIGLISPDQHRQARSLPIRVVPDRSAPQRSAAWFVEEVRRTLRHRIGSKGMALGGFTVKTTLRPSLQRHASQVLRRHLIAYDRRHGWRGPIANLADQPDWRSEWKTRLSLIARPKGAEGWSLAVVMDVGNREALVALADGRVGAIPLAELAWARRQVTIRKTGRPLFKTASLTRIGKPADALTAGDVVLVEAVTRDKQGKAYPDGTFALRQVPEVNGALVALDPQTGRILAISGGFSFARSQFNAASQAWRQPGSSFKPFVYLAALEAGLTPATVIPDRPLTLKLDRQTMWKPKNYDGRYRGPMSMRAALASSRNVVAVRLAQHAGLMTVTRMAGRFGLTNRRLRPLPSIALGARETTLVRLVTAYGMLANGGKPLRPTLIDRVTDRAGRVVYRHRVAYCPRCGDFRPAGLRRKTTPAKGADIVRPLADPRSIFQLITLMRGVVRHGTGRALRAVGVPVAGKTGTTNEHMDAWFVGFTPDMVVGVWIGFDRARTLGRREQGGFTAAPVARDFLKAAYAGRKIGEFVPPKGVKRVALRIESGTDEDGFPVYKTVKDWFKVDPATGEPLAGDAFIAGADDSEGFAREDKSQADRGDGSGGDADVRRGSDDRRGRVAGPAAGEGAPGAKRKPSRDTYGTYGR